MVAHFFRTVLPALKFISICCFIKSGLPIQTNPFIGIDFFPFVKSEGKSKKGFFEANDWKTEHALDRDGREFNLKEIEPYDKMEKFKVDCKILEDFANETLPSHNGSSQK